LDEVFHVPNVRKKLVSTSLLDQNGFTLVVGFNKTVVSVFKFYVGKCYLLNDLYKLSIMLSFNATLHFSSLFIANIGCCDSCHGRHGYVNFNTIKKIIHSNLIPKSHINNKKRKI
jgi:hypothetical protein